MSRCNAQWRIIRSQRMRPLLIILSLDLIAVFLAVFGAVWLGKHPGEFMGESQPLTWFSFLQLVMTAGIAGNIFYIRRAQSQGQKGWKAPFFVWFLIALGFVFLSIDEVTEFHEKLDHSIIHKRIFHMPETGLTDRLDDVIMGFYGLVGIGVFYWYRKELQMYRVVLPLLIFGGLFFFLMMVFDMTTNRNDILPLFIADPQMSTALYTWLKVIEDGCKILAEGIFLSVAYSCLDLTKKLPPPPMLEDPALHPSGSDAGARDG